MGAFISFSLCFNLIALQFFILFLQNKKRMCRIMRCKIVGIEVRTSEKGTSCTYHLVNLKGDRVEKVWQKGEPQYKIGEEVFTSFNSYGKPCILILD